MDIGDVVAHEEGLDVVERYVKKKMKEGAEEDWQLYEEAGQAARRQLGLDPFGINTPRKTVDNRSMEQYRRDAINEESDYRDRLHRYDG